MQKYWHRFCYTQQAILSNTKNKAMRLTNTYLQWSSAIQHDGLALSFTFC